MKTKECTWRYRKTDYTLAIEVYSNWTGLHLHIQGGSNMIGTDLCVNKPHCVAAVRPWESEATTSTLPPVGLEPVQSWLGVARVMSEQKVPRSVEQRIVIKFLVGENVPSAEIHHRLHKQYGEECLLRRHSSPYCCWSLWWISAGRDVFFNEEFEHNALFHAPRYLLFAHHSSNSQTGLNRS